MLRTILPLAAIATSVTLCAQVSAGGTPYGMRHGLSIAEVPTVHAAPFDAEAAAADDARREALLLLPAYGRALAVNADLDHHGLWTDLPGGDRLWRLRITSDGAQATELYFNMHLPEGASLFVQNEDGSYVLGAFTAYNNTADGNFATGLVQGESCLVEYFEPKEARGQGQLLVKELGHAYRMAQLGGTCEVDVNCSEGDGWEQQRDAVVRISVLAGGINYWCSGSLVNNLEQDCKPYFLTAKHCGEGTTTSEFNLWKFYFNYEKSGCGSGAAFQNHLVTGCTKRGDSNDGGGNSGSDFLLLEAIDPDIPGAYTPFWAGWDANNLATAGGVGIHHPAGTQKKISTYTATPFSTSWGGPPGTHWGLSWVATTNGHGVTEGGSSGSPIFNGAHRIVGTLTGGASCCTTGGCGPGTGPNAADYYGKMSYHWQSNPGSATTRLKAWLDPASTGVLSMDGSYDPCGSVIGIRENGASAMELGLFPNPADGLFTVQLPAPAGNGTQVEVTDALGRAVRSVDPAGRSKLQLDLRGETPGVYVVRLLHAQAVLGTARLLLR